MIAPNAQPLNNPKGVWRHSTDSSRVAPRYPLRQITMNTEELSKEQHIMRAMRKTLANVVRDVTPLGGRINPLTGDTIQDIKDCFALISERERELAELLDYDQAKPYYKDGTQASAQVISFTKPSRD